MKLVQNFFGLVYQETSASESGPLQCDDTIVVVAEEAPD